MAPRSAPTGEYDMLAMDDLYDGAAMVRLTDSDMIICAVLAKELKDIGKDTPEGYALRKRYGAEAQALSKDAYALVESERIHPQMHAEATKEALKVRLGVERGVMPLLAYNRAVDPRRDNADARMLNDLLFALPKPVQVPEYVRDGLDVLEIIRNIHLHEAREAEKHARWVKGWGMLNSALSAVTDHTVGRVVAFVRSRR